METVFFCFILFHYLALYERSKQDKNRDAGSDNEVDEVPEGQAAHLPQSHLLHLQAEPVPLVSQWALEANQHHLQSCTHNKQIKDRGGWEGNEERILSKPSYQLSLIPRYAAWLVDSAKPSLRRSFPVSPGVEQWAGEASSMKFLVREVEMMRGGRRILITVCRSKKISGCSRWGLSAKENTHTHTHWNTNKIDQERKLKKRTLRPIARNVLQNEIFIKCSDTVILFNHNYSFKQMPSLLLPLLPDPTVSTKGISRLSSIPSRLSWLVKGEITWLSGKSSFKA